MFLVGVASKGFSYTVSLLFATLAGRIISVASKGVRGVVSAVFVSVASKEFTPERITAGQTGKRVLA